MIVNTTIENLVELEYLWYSLYSCTEEYHIYDVCARALSWKARNEMFNWLQLKFNDCNLYVILCEAAKYAEQLTETENDY